MKKLPHMCGKCNEPVVLRQTDDENYAYGIEVLNFDGKSRHDCTERELLK